MPLSRRTEPCQAVDCVSAASLAAAGRTAFIVRTMWRLLDDVIALLMRPRVRRVRRWSFLVTVPVALVVAHVYGVHQGALVIAVRAALWGGVAVAAWRLGGERGEALRDLLMHPRARAFARAEFDILTALPRMIFAPRAPGTTYHRGTFGVPIGLALTPVVASEAAAIHLLLHGGLVAWIITGSHAYALLWLWGFALGPRAYPHRVGPRTAVLRDGPMYRVRVPLAAIASVEARMARVGERALSERDGAVLLAARGRVDVWLQLTEPVAVQRPLNEPLSTCRLAVASDDPELLVACLRAAPSAAVPPADGIDGLGLGLLGVLDVAGLARDAAQPA
jgi:hypothetical protein